MPFTKFFPGLRNGEFLLLHGEKALQLGRQLLIDFGKYFLAMNSTAGHHSTEGRSHNCSGQIKDFLASSG